MAEVIGLAASVLQIGGAGAKLSNELYHFISTASRANSDVTHIAVDVEVTSKVLGNVGKVLEGDNAKNMVNQDAIQHAKDLIKQCEEVFNELSDVVTKARKIDKDGRTRIGFRAKMSWPMKEQRVELLRRRLETLKSSLLVLFHVLQLAQDKARGDIEVAYLEEQKKNIRDLHQQQQDSLRILKALEQKLCIDNTNYNGPVQRSGACTPPIQNTATITSTAPPNSALQEQVNRNNFAMTLFKNLGPDTSDSDAVMTGDEGEQLTLDELAECAAQVQKLLRRIMALQDSLKSGKTEGHHHKRRMHKVYRRFCRKFEANIVDGTAAGRADGHSDYGRKSIRAAFSAQGSSILESSLKTCSRVPQTGCVSSDPPAMVLERHPMRVTHTAGIAPDDWDIRNDVNTQHRRTLKRTSQYHSSASRPMVGRSPSKVVRHAVSRRESIYTTPIPYPKYNADLPAARPSTSTYESKGSRAERPVSYDMAQKSHRSKSKHARPTIHTWSLGEDSDTTSADEKYASTSRGRGPPPSMSAYGYRYPPLQDHLAGHAVPSPYYSQPRHIQPSYDSPTQHLISPIEPPRPPVSAHAPSDYRHQSNQARGYDHRPRTRVSYTADKPATQCRKIPFPDGISERDSCKEPWDKVELQKHLRLERRTGMPPASKQPGLLAERRPSIGPNGNLSPRYSHASSNQAHNTWSTGSAPSSLRWENLRVQSESMGDSDANVDEDAESRADQSMSSTLDEAVQAAYALQEDRDPPHQRNTRAVSSSRPRRIRPRLKRSDSDTSALESYTSATRTVYTPPPADTSAKSSESSGRPGSLQARHRGETPTQHPIITRQTRRTLSSSSLSEPTEDRMKLRLCEDNTSPSPPHPGEAAEPHITKSNAVLLIEDSRQDPIHSSYSINLTSPMKSARPAAQGSRQARERGSAMIQEMLTTASSRRRRTPESRAAAAPNTIQRRPRSPHWRVPPSLLEDAIPEYGYGGSDGSSGEDKSSDADPVIAPRRRSMQAGTQNVRTKRQEPVTMGRSSYDDKSDVLRGVGEGKGREELRGEGRDADVDIVDVLLQRWTKPVSP